VQFGLHTDAVRLAITLANQQLDNFYCLVRDSLPVDQAMTLQAVTHKIPTLLEFSSPGSHNALSLANTILREQLHASLTVRKILVFKHLLRAKILLR